MDGEKEEVAGAGGSLSVHPLGVLWGQKYTQKWVETTWMLMQVCWQKNPSLMPLVLASREASIAPLEVAAGRLLPVISGLL